MADNPLSRLGARLTGDQCGELKQALMSAEQLVPMSVRYRELLLKYGGAIVFDNGARFACDEQSPLCDKDGYLSLEILFGLGNGKYSIERKAAQYEGEVPASFVPVGETSGENLICVAGDGAVHLWDHESPRNGRTWRIAASIDEFLMRLETDRSGIGTTDGIIKSESFLDF